MIAKRRTDTTAIVGGITPQSTSGLLAGSWAACGREG